jgi:thiol-disulfide isomerase/thioredoxin
MRRLLLLLALAAAAGCQQHRPAADGSADAAAAAHTGTGSKIDRGHAGQPAPATAFDDADGDATTLAAFQGKPALVNFWATWCAPCKKELPSLDRLAVARRDKLQVVTIAEDRADKAAAYLQQGKFAKLEAWTDAKLAMTDSLRINDLPTTILFDAKGREIWRSRGDRDWQSAETGALVAEAFK